MRCVEQTGREEKEKESDSDSAAPSWSTEVPGSGKRLVEEKQRPSLPLWRSGPKIGKSLPEIPGDLSQDLAIHNLEA